MTDCLFCKIIDRKIPAKIRYVDDDFMAFDDIKPKAKTHILLVPKLHIHSIAAIEGSDETLMGKMIMTAKKVAIKAGLDSFRLVFNSGADAGAEVDHVHMHILGGNKLGDIA
jgi:histidine triad (HIT) family protein